MERLQKVIAHAGFASRRKAEQFIQEGKVSVNGRVVTELGTKVSETDEIEVNGIPVEREEPVYFLLYKPRGCISAVEDDKGRQVVTDYLEEVPERIYPVGRLDYDTSGVLLLTNDGEFANLMTHPKHEIDKVYVAKVEGVPSKETLRQLEKGVRLDDGRTAPATARLLKKDRAKGKAIVELTIHEGKNRQVKRMFEAVGHSVEKLKRERLGFLNVDGMDPGEYRELSPKEVKRLRAQALNMH